MKNDSKKQRLSRASSVTQHNAQPGAKRIPDSYIRYIENEKVLYWAMLRRLRRYMENPNDGTKGDRDVILKDDCRTFIEIVNGLPYMQHWNLGIFQSEIDLLYEDFLSRIREEEELHNLGICEKAQDMETRRLVRDKVISVVEGEELVGVYWEGTDGSDTLFECSPEKADRIIEIFNEEEPDRVLYVTVYFYGCVELTLHPAATLEQAQDKVDEIKASKGYREACDGLGIETITLTPKGLASLEPAAEAEQGGERQYQAESTDA